jgi:hypothetical protein
MAGHTYGQCSGSTIWDSTGQSTKYIAKGSLHLPQLPSGREKERKHGKK